MTKARCAKMAPVGHDGLARAVRPAHSMFDGNTIFGLSTGGAASHDRDAGTHDTTGPGGPSLPMLSHQMLAVAADCFTRAIVHAVLSSASVTPPRRELARLPRRARIRRPAVTQRQPCTSPR
jgi:L-aminopeptidase/D-esterase-like protein